MFIVPDNREPFEFKVGKKVYSVPTIQSMPVSKVREIVNATKGLDGAAYRDAMLDVVSGIFEEHAPGIIDRLSMEQFTALVNAYIGDGEAMGESSGSSD